MERRTSAVVAILLIAESVMSEVPLLAGVPFQSTSWLVVRFHPSISVIYELQSLCSVDIVVVVWASKHFAHTFALAIRAAPVVLASIVALAPVPDHHLVIENDVFERNNPVILELIRDALLLEEGPSLVQELLSEHNLLF